MINSILKSSFVFNVTDITYESVSIIFDEYTPEKFYISNKFLLNWTHNHFNQTERYYFINAFHKNPPNFTLPNYCIVYL